jgi:calcineurin-like phosphoesterase family protein
MANLWFISDTHFSHANIIQYSNRPFSGPGEMDEIMVKLWNERVRPSDHIYHLGDVSMMRPKHIKHILDRLQGHKRLVRGNHDIYKTKEYIEAGFEEIYGVRVLDNIMFTHIPIHPNSMGQFRANVHGHTHNSQEGRFPPVCRIKENKAEWVPYINISVEVTDYHPIDFEEVRQRIKKASNSYGEPEI